MCGHGAPRSGKLPAEPDITAVTSEIEAWSGEMSEILLSANVPAPEVEVIVESEPPKAR